MVIWPWFLILLFEYGFETSMDQLCLQSWLCMHCLFFVNLTIRRYIYVKFIGYEYKFCGLRAYGDSLTNDRLIPPSWPRFKSNQFQIIAHYDIVLQGIDRVWFNIIFISATVNTWNGQFYFKLFIFWYDVTLIKSV